MFFHMVFHLFIIPELDVFALFKFRKPPDDGVSSFEKNTFLSFDKVDAGSPEIGGIARGLTIA